MVRTGVVVNVRIYKKDGELVCGWLHTYYAHVSGKERERMETAIAILIASLYLSFRFSIFTFPSLLLFSLSL
ncbi:hypothetical protein VNO80_03765 [Phaseolus coccineus]|uniref:Uncharacterized protein n=1 Tax=Phaseolus coccineus TaxID=3886 RepID=A0AAN9NSL0_PHACN